MLPPAQRPYCPCVNTDIAESHVPAAPADSLFTDTYLCSTGGACFANTGLLM